MSKKYSSASDSLKPGQLDRLTAKIKDCNPQKKELFTVKELFEAIDCIGCDLLSFDSEFCCTSKCNLKTFCRKIHSLIQEFYRKNDD